MKIQGRDNSSLNQGSDDGDGEKQINFKNPWKVKLTGSVVNQIRVTDEKCTKMLLRFCTELVSTEHRRRNLFV